MKWRHFNAFAQDIGRGVHNLNADSLKVALSNTLPLATDSFLADITQIAAGHGYETGGKAAAANAYSQTNGSGKLTANDIVFTASGGSIEVFRYVVLYNDTPTSPADPLIAWFDNGSPLTLAAGDSLTVTWNEADGLFTLS